MMVYVCGVSLLPFGLIWSILSGQGKILHLESWLNLKFKRTEAKTCYLHVCTKPCWCQLTGNWSNDKVPTGNLELHIVGLSGRKQDAGELINTWNIA
jgi:hypothetical protein